MSQQMNQAKESVEKIINKIEAGSHASKEPILEQLKNIDKLIAQNQAKIWLRTRSGKPMAAKIETAAAGVWKLLGEDADITKKLSELQEVAKEIDEESQRRSMVVT